MGNDKNFRLVKKMSIQRLGVEKACVAMQQFLGPLELGKKSKIVVEYDPELPFIIINFYSKQ